MGDLARGETRQAFEGLVNAVPTEVRTRAWQLLESLVFTAAPMLNGVRFLGIAEGTGPPGADDFPEEGIGLYYDLGASEGYFVWAYDDQVMSVVLL